MNVVLGSLQTGETTDMPSSYQQQIRRQRNPEQSENPREDRSERYRRGAQQLSAVVTLHEFRMSRAGRGRHDDSENHQSDPGPLGNTGMLHRRAAANRRDFPQEEAETRNDEAESHQRQARSDPGQQR